MTLCPATYRQALEDAAKACFDEGMKHDYRMQAPSSAEDSVAYRFKSRRSAAMVRISFASPSLASSASGLTSAGLGRSAFCMQGVGTLI